MQIAMFFLRLVEWALKLYVQILMTVLGAIWRGLSGMLSAWNRKRAEKPSSQNCQQRLQPQYTAAKRQPRRKRR